MASIINLALRGLQFFFTLLILAIDGNIIAEASKGNPSIINYVIFVAVFGMLSLIYLITATIKEDFAIAPMFMVIADAINTLLFLIGGIALAAYLGVHECTNHSYVSSNKITNGSDNQPKRCREAQAVTAFLWFGFAAFAGSLVFSFLGMRSGLAPSGGGIRRGPGKV